MSPRHRLALAALSLGEPIPVDLMAELEAAGLILSDEDPSAGCPCDIDYGDDPADRPRFTRPHLFTADL